MTTTGGDAGPDAEPPACAEGSWDHDGDTATSCVAWTGCTAGTFASAEGSPTADRLCTACPEDTFSDTMNAPSCRVHTPCAPGTTQTAPGTSTTPAQCGTCSPGTYCAGGTAAPVDCADGTWDDDADPATTCVAWTDCVPGELVGTDGSSTTDRSCLKCTNGEHTATMNATSCSPGAWVLSYFGPHQDVPSDSLHLAYSTDGLHWSNLANAQPAYQLTGMGTNHIRDPFLFRKNDGTYVYIATDWTLSNNDSNYWNHPSSKIFVADSTDLITFTNPRLITLTNLPGPGATPMHAWAPEAYYDPDRKLYAIIWSGNDTTGANRIYVSYTEDFVTIVNPTPDVLFDPGYSVIDATITQWNDRNYLFFKDETDSSGSALTGSGKDIQIARSSTLALDPATFTRWDPDYVTRGSTQSTRRATEGPFVIKDPRQSRWYLFADYYLNGGVFGCWSTTDLDMDPGSWTELPSAQYRFPSGVRHANAVRVTQAELDAIIAHYGTSYRIRSTYSEASVPFYVTHSWFHGIITQESDRSDGQLANDFLWKVVPGLADTSDPDLVSFEAVELPGRYLRIDGVDPTRYPSCSDGSNRSEYLCTVDSASRHHLTWLDTFTDTATFRSDATFRRVPALNGDASMVSLQWHGNESLYLRHSFYQVFATTVDGGTAQNNDASFTIERD